MMKLRNLAGIALACIASGAMAQAVTFYESEGFRGHSFAKDSPIDDFQHYGFNDRASSVIIRRGEWQICSDAHFGGHCVTLRPGSYPNLGAMGLNDAVSSARPVGGGHMHPQPAVVEAAPYTHEGYPHEGGERASPVTLFEGTGLSGGVYRVGGDIANLDRTQWNDRARSMIVREGRWELCTDANFQGNCMVFGPGRYDNIGNQTGGVSSLRRVR